MLLILTRQLRIDNRPDLLRIEILGELDSIKIAAEQGSDRILS
jgi:hypothetical protein